MEYINKVSGERKTHRALCIALNASIPRGADYGDWTTIKHQPMPAVGENQVAVMDGVEKVDGVWYYKWSVQEQPAVVEPVPEVVSSFQAFAQLEVEGVLSTVEAYFDAPDTPRIEKLAFQKAQEFMRHSPTVAKLAEMLNWDSEKLDQVFRAASKIIA